MSEIEELIEKLAGLISSDDTLAFPIVVKWAERKGMVVMPLGEYKELLQMPFSEAEMPF